MLLQQFPFRGWDGDEIYDVVIHDESFYFMDMSNDAGDLIQKLFARESKGRFGYHKGVEECMNHEVFKRVD